MTVQQAIWKMVRPLNLAIILVSVLSIGGALKQLGNLNVSLFDLVIYGICLGLIAAGGNILNDIVDVKADNLNQKLRNPVSREIPRGLAWTLYLLLTFLGLFIAWSFSEVVDQIFLLLTSTAVLLILYSIWFQKLPLIGNITVALLCSVPALLVGSFFKFLPDFSSIDIWQEVPRFPIGTLIVLLYASHAFALNLIRELIKDIEDMKGDTVAKYWTIPVLFGFQSAKTGVLSQAFGTLILEFLIAYLMWNSKGIWHEFAPIFLAFGPVALAPIVILISRMKSSGDALSISRWLKFVMVLGIATTAFFWFL